MPKTTLFTLKVVLYKLYVVFHIGYFRSQNDGLENKKCSKLAIFTYRNG